MSFTLGRVDPGLRSGSQPSAVWLLITEHDLREEDSGQAHRLVAMDYGAWDMLEESHKGPLKRGAQGQGPTDPGRRLCWVIWNTCYLG